MAMTTTEFVRTGEGAYKCTVSPDADTIDVHIVRSRKGGLYVYKSIGGLTPAPVYLPKGYYENESVVLRIGGVAGMEVTIQSSSPVTACKVMELGGEAKDIPIDNDLRVLADDGSSLLTDDGYELCLE